MKEIAKLGLTLMIISLIAGAALSFTNYYTAKQIEKQREMLMKESLNKVIDAESFKEKDNYYEAYDKDGNIIGRVLKVQAPGYSSTISALVGIDTGNKIKGVAVVSQQETPGLGSNIEKDSFLSQFIGKEEGSLVLKKDGGSIDAVTGATISSRALTDGIKNAINTCSFAEEKDGTA